LLNKQLGGSSMANIRRKKIVVVDKSMRELFVRSRIEPEYTWLFNLLKQDFYEKIYKTDFEDTSDFDEKKQTFLLHVFEDYLSSIAKQWFRYSKMIVKENGTCELCGQKHTKYMYKIKNRLTKTIMLIGSTCIERFKDIDAKLPEGMNLKQFNRQQKRAFERVKKQELFIQKFGNVNHLIKSWNDEFNSLPYELPDKIHKEVPDLHEKARKIYSDYLDGKITDASFPDFDQIVRRRNALSEEMAAIMGVNSQNPHACPRTVGNWLIKNKKDLVLLKIRQNNGIITKEAISSIYEPDFVSRHVKKFNAMLGSTRLTIESRETGLFVSFEDRQKRLNLLFELKNSNLMETFADRLFDENAQIDEKELLDVVSLAPSELNDALVDVFSDLLRGTGFRLKYIKDGHYLVNSRKDLYANDFRLVQFINIHKSTILLKGRAGIKEIKPILEKFTDWRSLDEHEKYEFGDISKIPNF